MVFNMTVDGPFDFVKTKSNTGAAHPLATTVPSKSKFEGGFMWRGRCETKSEYYVLFVTE